MQVTFAVSNDRGGKWLCCKNVYSALNGPDLLACQVGKGQGESEMGWKSLGTFRIYVCNGLPMFLFPAC